MCLTEDFGPPPQLWKSITECIRYGCTQGLSAMADDLDLPR